MTFEHAQHLNIHIYVLEKQSQRVAFNMETHTFFFSRHLYKNSCGLPFQKPSHLLSLGNWHPPPLPSGLTSAFLKPTSVPFTASLHVWDVLQIWVGLSLSRIGHWIHLPCSFILDLKKKKCFPGCKKLLKKKKGGNGVLEIKVTLQDHLLVVFLWVRRDHSFTDKYVRSLHGKCTCEHAKCSVARITRAMHEQSLSFSLCLSREGREVSMN